MNSNASSKLIASWVVGALAIGLAMVFHLLAGIALLPVYYFLRKEAGVPQMRLGEILAQIHWWPPVAVIYYLCLCVVAFMNLDRIYELCIICSVLIFFFPIAVPAWVFELCWYRKLKSKKLFEPTP